tara:strand:+ start:168 stop:1307 length:1140 start_codon:yes stop_codon:yes gene_type:complete
MGGLIAKLIRMGFTKSRALEAAKKIYRLPTTLQRQLTTTKTIGRDSFNDFRDTIAGKIIKNRAKAAVRKDLLSEKGWDLYRKNLKTDLSEELSRRKKEFRDYIQYTNPKHKKEWLLQIKKLQNTKKYLDSPKAYSEYSSLIRAQLDGGVIRFNPIQKPTVTGHAYRGKDMSMHKVSVPSDKLFDLSHPSENLRIAAKKVLRGKDISKLDYKNKDFPLLDRVETHGLVEVDPNKAGLLGQYSTLIHELKHLAQAPLRGGYGPIDKLIKKTKKGVPKIKAEAELLHATHNDKWSLENLEHVNYLLRPWEISARISQYRALPKIIRRAFDNTSKADIGKRPEWYQDLRDIFGDGGAVNNASKKIWGAAMVPAAGSTGIMGDE